MTVSANPTMYSATATALAREKMIPIAPPGGEKVRQPCICIHNVLVQDVLLLSHINVPTLAYQTRVQGNEI